VKANSELRNQILRVVENQIKSNQPEETRKTYKRLVAKGYSEVEAKQLIGQCVLVEIFSVLKEQKPFNEDRFVKNLKQLPKVPSD
jgi:hypothetical protein